MSKLEEAKEILSSLKVPAKQQNGMCCCVLLEMTNYETLQKICERAKENIDLLNTSGKLDALSKCIAFADDLHKWVSYCDNVKDYILVKEAQTECINSIYMCAQGFYKE